MSGNITVASGSRQSGDFSTISQARGEATPESDIDILILLNSGISSQERNGIHDMLYEIGLEHDVAISVPIKSISHWELPMSRATSLYQAVQNEGILVA
jgi:hypothetical protein